MAIIFSEGKKEMLKGARRRATRESLKVIRQEKDNRKDIAALQVVVGKLQRRLP